MLKPFTGILERCEHHEQFVVALIRGDLTVCERVAVALTLDGIFDARLSISAANAMAVDRVDRSITVDGTAGGHQCLRHQLTAERPRTYLRRVMTAERVVSDTFEIEQTEKCFQVCRRVRVAHASGVLRRC